MSEGEIKTGRIRWWRLALPAAVLAGAIAAVVRGGWSPPDKHEAGVLRIVSLAPNVTEMLFVLGLGGTLVGATDYCDYPPEAKKIPRVGGLGAPNIEKLLALRPDLVITTDLERKDAADTIRGAGTRLLEIRMESLEELFAGFVEIGGATGAAQRAEEAVAAMRARLARAAQRYKEIPSEKRKSVFVELSGDPLTTVGGTSFIDEVIARAGGVNAAHDLSQPYPHVNPEKVIEWNPDFILLCYMVPQGAGAKRLSRRIGWARIKAIKEGHVIDDITPDLILRPGPRVVDGVELLAQRFYGP
ncbi:MAG: cobalamin-binding protein [Planctomycetota bacterium]